MKRSFMTSLPDTSGAFLTASRIILRHGGNMVRASYNKAVDAHMLFVDVEGEEEALDAIEADLTAEGFLQNESRVKVVLIEAEVPNQPGGIIRYWRRSKPMASASPTCPARLPARPLRR